MTLDDAASILDVTEDHVKRLLRKGKIKGLKQKSGRVWKYVLDGKSVRSYRAKQR